MSVKRFATLAAGSAFAFIVAYYFWRNGESERGIQLPEVSAPSPSPFEPVPVAELAREEVSADPLVNAREDCRVVVIDSYSAPIVAARVYTAEAPIPRIVYGLNPLGLTNSDGELLLPTPSSDIIVAADDFVPERISHPALLDGDETVTLAPANAQELLCEDLNGVPLQDIELWLSQAALPEFLPAIALGKTQWLSPDSIMGASTNALGRVRISGLPPGRYCLRVSSPRFSVVDGMEAPVIVPGPPLTLRLGLLVGVVLRVSGDEVVTYQANVSGGLGFAGLWQDDCTAARAALAKQFPEDIAFVALQMRRDASLVASVRLLLRDKGIHEVSVSLVPVTEIIAAQSIDVHGMSFTPTEPTYLRVEDANQMPIDGSAYYVAIDGDPTTGIIVTMNPWGENRLPPGSYRLRCFNPWLKAAMEETEVAAPGDHHVRLSGAFAKCRIILLDQDGAPTFPAIVTVEAEGISKQYNIQTPEMTIWLPKTYISITATTDGALTYRTSTDLHDVHQTVGDERIDIPLVMQ